MGGAAHLVLVGGSRRALGAAVERLHDLERRWSRFRPDSEITGLNDHPGRPRRVSTETVLLVGLAQEGWRRTAGRFDPTLLHALRAAGYGDALPRGAATPAAPTRTAHDPATCGRIALDRDAGTVCLPPGAGFDPGGIGKGLAADLVAGDLLDSGAAGACVNVGGDLRLWGHGPSGPRWRVAIPALPGRALALTDAAVATSGTTRRRWTVDGRVHHHLIDPATLRPSRTGIASATVAAPAAWLAEVYAVAALLSTPRRAVADLARWGVDGAVVADDGTARVSPGLRA